jgi:CDP-glucose 4,6-dehydratase
MSPAVRQLFQEEASWGVGKKEFYPDANMILAERLAENSRFRGEAFNFSNENKITVLELVERILALTGSKLKPDVRNEATNEIRHQYLSAAKARKMLGWRPRFTLDEGLRRTISWYEAFLGTSL